MPFLSFFLFLCSLTTSSSLEDCRRQKWSEVTWHIVRENTPPSANNYEKSIGRGGGGGGGLSVASVIFLSFLFFLLCFSI